MISHKAYLSLPLLPATTGEAGAALHTGRANGCSHFRFHFRFPFTFHVHVHVHFHFHFNFYPILALPLPL